MPARVMPARVMLAGLMQALVMIEADVVDICCLSLPDLSS
jgi:hypothetical protein